MSLSFGSWWRIRASDIQLQVAHVIKQNSHIALMIKHFGIFYFFTNVTLCNGQGRILRGFEFQMEFHKISKFLSNHATFESQMLH